MKKLTLFLLLFPFVAMASFSSYTIEIASDSQYIENSIKSSPGAVLTPKTIVLSMVEEAGFDPKVANATIQAESGWNPLAVGDGGESLGLWQIHQPAHPIGRDCAFDPVCSTEYAIKLLQSKRSWNHWSAYRHLFGVYTTP